MPIRPKLSPSPPSTRELFSALGDHRQTVVKRARAAGCDLERWRPLDWLRMARELTRLEDDLEALGSRAAAVLERRAAVRAVRRKLEVALDCSLG